MHVIAEDDIQFLVAVEVADHNACTNLACHRADPNGSEWRKAIASRGKTGTRIDKE